MREVLEALTERRYSKKGLLIKFFFMNLTKLLVFYLVSTFLNFLWEFRHCSLYTTCRRMKDSTRRVFLSFMSLKDGLILTAFYLLTSSMVGEVASTSGVLVLACLGLGFAFVDERYSTSRKRWEYTDSMPTFLGVGISPLLQLAVIGVVATPLMAFF